MRKTTVKELGLTLKYLREKAGLTQVQLAEKMETHQPSIARWENGKETPKIETLEKLAEALEVRLEIRFVKAVGER